MTLAEFINALEPAKPAYNYAVSSVERNMFRANVLRAAGAEGFTGADLAQIVRVMEDKIARTPYQNWSGD